MKKFFPQGDQNNDPKKQKASISFFAQSARCFGPLHEGPKINEINLPPSTRKPTESVVFYFAQNH